MAKFKRGDRVVLPANEWLAEERGVVVESPEPLWPGSVLVLVDVAEAEDDDRLRETDEDDMELEEI